MARTKRQLMVALMMTALVAAGRSVLAGGTDAPGMPRVRSSSPAIVALIGQAAERSETFRRLIETIDASDGIVYVEEGRCGRGVRACFVAVTEAGANRVLHVIVDTRKAEWDLMGSIGHELRHTIEVLGERHVRSGAAMYHFYAREGRRGTTQGTFETDAAVAAGQNVRAEVRKSQPRREAFNPGAH